MQRCYFSLQQQDLCSHFTFCRDSRSHFDFPKMVSFPWDRVTQPL